MDFTKYTDYTVEKTVEVLSIDSPTGFTDNAALCILILNFSLSDKYS